MAFLPRLYPYVWREITALAQPQGSHPVGGRQHAGQPLGHGTNPAAPHSLHCTGLHTAA